MKQRIQITFIMFTLLFAVVAAKAFYIQVVNKDRLLTYARSQFMREAKIYPARGNIFDRNGTPLAINVQIFNMFTFPRAKGPAYRHELQQLARIVPQLSYSQLWGKVKNRKKYTWLARKIALSEAQIEKIKKLENIHLEALSDRVYPNHELSSQVLGFVGLDNGGLAGIERVMDKTLRGSPRLVRYVRDAKGRPVQYETGTAPDPSDDVTLSIDKELQGTLEVALKEAVIHHQALRGGAGVMDAVTGEILAVANYPSFDPNKPTAYPADQRRLAFFTDPFEPGSVFKTLTIASALEHNIARPEKRYFCEYGKLRVQNHIISEAESDKKFEWLTVADILKYSSNVGTTKIAFDLGYPRLKETLKKFHIGDKTGVEVMGESNGIMTRSEKIKPLALSNISFGHGIATTAIQILRAYATVANGGYLIKPTLLKKEDSQLIEKNRVISAKTAKELSSMLVRAVEDGTGTNARIPHYTIAGKTGTAQRVSPRGGYEGYIASFAGFPVNVSHPFVVFAYVDNPHAHGYYGNVAAAPIFRKVTQQLLYKTKKFAPYAHYNPEANAKNLDTVSVGQAASRLVGAGRMPNFLGLDKASALRMAESLNLRIELTGFGVVSRQEPSAGEAVAGVKELRLHFTPPSYEE